MRAAEIMRKFMKAVEEDPTTDIANLTAPTSSPKPPPTNVTTPPAPGDLTFGKGKMNIATGDTSNVTIGKAPAPTLPAGAYFNMGKPTDSSGQWSAGVGVGKAKEMPGTSDPKFSINFSKKF
jgi:hypothetical protein